MFFNEIKTEGGNTYYDCNLLEIAFFQNSSYDAYSFMREAMFTDEIDLICERYDFSDELPESELHYTTYQEVKKFGVSEEYHENMYLVIIDRLDNISIYKKVEVSNED